MKKSRELSEDLSGLGLGKGCGVRSGLHVAGWFVERPHVNEAGYVNSGAVFRPPYVVREG